MCNIYRDLFSIITNIEYILSFASDAAKHAHLGPVSAFTVSCQKKNLGENIDLH
jgi:hypothetical protein